MKLAGISRIIEQVIGEQGVKVGNGGVAALMHRGLASIDGYHRLATNSFVLADENAPNDALLNQV